MFSIKLNKQQSKMLMNERKFDSRIFQNEI